MQVLRDARSTLAGDNLAPFAYEGVVRAHSFKAVLKHQVIAPTAEVRADPTRGAVQIDQILFGEHFDVLAMEDAHAWGQACRSGYVGWVRVDRLSVDLVEPTHWVGVLRTAVLTAPDIRAPTSRYLSLNSLLRVQKMEGNFVEAEKLGWVPARHVRRIGEGCWPAQEVARLHLGLPYVWGGRDSLGLDCSGLIQQSLFASGIASHRDADQQATQGREVEQSSLSGGDLVAWRGHIGMMLDRESLIHANAFHMAVAVEPLFMAVERIEVSGGGPPVAFRRLECAVSSDKRHV